MCLCFQSFFDLSRGSDQFIISLSHPNHAEGVSVCAKRNIIGRSPHHLHEVQLHLRHGATSFICAAWSGNDVLALLEMMLTLRANDVVPCGTNEKIQLERVGFFWQPNRDFSGATAPSRRKRLALVGENSPPDCFLPSPSGSPSWFESLCIIRQQKQKTTPFGVVFVLAAE